MELQNIKYYTPSIEEFHIGFEYEWLNENNDWIKENSPTEITVKDFNEQTFGLRVKLLDKEDIESLGWKLKSQTNNKGYGDWCVFKLNKNELSIQFHRVNDNYPNKLTIRNNYLNVSILIKNKSELIKLIKQLEI